MGAVQICVIHIHPCAENGEQVSAVPSITIATSLAHALAGAVLGPRMVSRTRSKNSGQAVLLGALASLLAQLLFAPPFAMWVSRANVHPKGVISQIGLTLLVALFAFLAVGWALLLVSAFIGWSLHRLATSNVRNSSSNTLGQ